MKDSKVKILDKIEDEALEMLKSFKEHPIKSVVIALFVIWGIKQIYKLIKGE